MPYSLEAEVEAARLEEQIHQSNYDLSDELRALRFDPDESVMDAGCGTGVLSRYLVDHYGIKHVDAVDSSELRLQQGRKLLGGRASSAIRFHHQDLGNLSPEFHGRYDTVICRYVVEHVGDPVRVIGELRKALKKGGRLVIIELDGVFFNLYSGNPMLQRYLQELKSQVSFDLEIGRKVPSMLKRAGFARVDWDASLLCCKGRRLEEERRNTEMRFAALGGFLASALGSKERAEEFARLYLEEMAADGSTLVFTKYVCVGEGA